MDVIEAIKTRKSIRAFKPDPVSRAILEDILRTASLSPSAANLQPWEFIVVTGESLKKLTQANIDKFKAGETGSWDLRRGARRAQVPEKYLKRLASIQTQAQRQMNYIREDKEARAEFMQRGFNYFGAPAVIIITLEKSLGDTHTLDIGIVTQTICLAALQHGLGTCIQAQGVMYSNMMREMFGIPDSKYLVIAIAIGYPDWSHPVNQMKSGRESLENLTTWVGFKE